MHSWHGADWHSGGWAPLGDKGMKLGLVVVFPGAAGSESYRQVLVQVIKTPGG
jgi:hypothetical protein